MGADTSKVYSTGSKTKEAGVIVPEVHGVNKGLDLHVKPEHQKPKTQTRPAISAPSLAQNIAKKLVSKSVKTLCRLATRMGGREVPPEGPKPESEETGINMPRQIPTVLEPTSLPGEFLFHPKCKHQSNLIFRELLENIQVGKH